LLHQLKANKELNIGNDFLDLLGLNINWDIVLFSAPIADVTFLFFSFLFYIVQATHSIK